MAWTDDEIQDLKYMIDKNFTRKEIAEVLDKSVDQISRKMKTLGLKFNTKFKDGLYLCFTCRTYKDKSEFYSHVGSPYDISSKCKTCESENQKERYRKQQLKKFQKDIKTKEEATGLKEKKCPKCGIVKDIEEFTLKADSIR